MISGVIWGLGGFMACDIFGASLGTAIGVTVVTAIIGALKAGG